MKSFIKFTSNGIKYVEPSATRALERANCIMPTVDKVIFGLKTEDSVAVTDGAGEIVYEETDGRRKAVRKAVKLDGPVLATTIYFSDGTSSTVVNSKLDKVDLTTHKLSDGTTVEVATEQAKEAGIAFAMLKRVLGVPDKNGATKNSAIAKFLADAVKNAIDVRVVEAEQKIQKAARKAKKAEREAHKAKPKKYRSDDIMQALGPLVEALAAKIKADPVAAETLMKNLGI